MDDKRTRILLVEDDPDDAFLLREMLAEVPSVQFEVEQANRLSAATERASAESFDVVLLDLTLPDSHGLDTFLQLHERVPDTPVVVLTGVDDETLAVRAVQEGAQDYLVKSQVTSGSLVVRSLRYAIERQRTRRYRALLMERERFDTAVSHMSDGIVVTDGEWRLTTANRAACLLLNLPENGWEGRALDDVLAPFVLSRPMAELRECGDHAESVEIARPHTTPPLYLDARLTRLHDGAGNLVSAVLMLRDITERRREQVFQANLLMVVSHKLRTPLTVLMACHDLCERMASDREAQHMPEVAEVCGAETRRLGGIVEGLLELKALSRPELQAAGQTADLAAALEQSSEAVRARHPGKQLVVSVEVASDAAAVGCSPEHLCLVLEKLLDNAAKFGDRDPVRVVVSAERLQGPWVRISLADNGPGIPHEYYDRIFSGFVQVEDQPTGQVPGLGVGLYIARNVVQAYGGTISVHSQLGEGATFSLTLPAE